ncbi:MAG: hypothetical protein DRP35_01155 [Candidatus Zixiibacteriota bacterium]|nr:MAG: hypothetical protein DRP35_01155 [candidate division Zixibacteria bacterium]
MRLNELERYGIPKRIIKIWQKRQGDSMLPVQSKAVRKGLLGKQYDNRHEPVSMLIAAPTSSGKSFCAELAAMKALTMRKRVIMLFPLKSLAEQKYQLFSETYALLGIKCLIVTGDYPENDQAFTRGNYQIAVAIYEKFDQLLTSSMDTLKNIGLVVVDEIQTISEPGRGAILERLLTKIKASVYSPSLVGLSAVIGCDDNDNNPAVAESLSEWLQATLVEESIRPVDLIRGIAAEGTFKYRSYNNHLDGSEPYMSLESGVGDGLFNSFINQVKNSNGSTLIFLKSRMDTVNFAFRLASSVDWKGATQAIAKLGDEEPSYLIRSLCQVMSKGVAFHNSDLSQKQRFIIEEAFKNKSIRAIISTTTLAMGVNLPIDTVYLETVKYVSGKYNDKPSLVPVSRSEFENMTGRAGRLLNGQSNNPGRAIVLAENSFDRDILWENYIAGNYVESFRSVFRTMPLIDWILNMLVTSLADSLDSLFFLYQNTLHAQIEKSKALNHFDFDEAVQLLIDNDLVKKGEDDSRKILIPTSTGKVTALVGLSVLETVYYLKKLKIGYPDNLASWMTLALSGPGWKLPPAILSQAEFIGNEPLKILYRFYDDLIPDVSRLVSSRFENEPLTYRGAASLKAVLLLCDWCHLVPVRGIEERFQVHLGQILNLAETVSYLISALSRLIEVTNRNLSYKDELWQYQFSLRHGLPLKWCQWYACFGRTLNRNDYVNLSELGIDELSELCNLSQDEKKRIFKEKSKLRLINEKIETIKEEVEMSASSLTVEAGIKGNGAVLFGKPELVEIDGSYERERYLVKINGFPVRLTGKSFKYFAKLAFARFKGGSGWIYKEDIEVGFNQARYLYRMKNEMAAGLNMDWQVIENNRLGYYRLNVEPSKIIINYDNLRGHPDYEIQAMVANQSKPEQSKKTIKPLSMPISDDLRSNPSL